MRRLLFAAIAASVLVLGACGGSSSSVASDGGDLTGLTWVLDRASMLTLATGDVPADARIDIVFEGTELSGRAACNSYFGGYVANAADGTLSISQLGSTQMACEEPLMSMETGYLVALGDVAGYQVTGGGRGLVLTGGEAALTYQAEQPAAPLSLESTAWTLTTIGMPDTQAVSSTLAGTEVTALFVDGRVSGTGGCNTYHATADVAADTLAIGPIASTKKSCADDVNQQEADFFDALAATRFWSVEGDQLSLSSGNGDLLLGFVGASP